MAVISIAHSKPQLAKGYSIAAMSILWREAGHDVRVGRGFAPDADLCILHLDQTRITPNQIPKAPPGIRVLNSAVLDISKRTVSTHLLTPDSDWDRPVIVKSDLNHFGAPEKRRKSQPETWKAWTKTRLAEISWRHARQLPHRRYPVVPHLRKVPAWVWRHPGLVVEKFLPEMDQGFYCLRGWKCLGDQSYGWRLFATDPMVKTSTMVKYEYITETPPELLAYRAAHNYDFGKFDYVMIDGKPILLDANKTPGFSGDGRGANLVRLATGIEDYLK